MLWVICAAAALLVGLVMFSELQTKLPEELSFLKTKDGGGQVLDRVAPSSNTTAIVDNSINAVGWSMRADGTSMEAVKDFNESITGSNGQTYDKPEFGITCYQGALYARINTRLRAAGQNPIQLDVKNPAGWGPGKSQDWYSGDSLKLLSTIKARNSITAKISFEEAGQQSFTLNTKGLSAVLAKMPQCLR